MSNCTIHCLGIQTPSFLGKTKMSIHEQRCVCVFPQLNGVFFSRVDLIIFYGGTSWTSLCAVFCWYDKHFVAIIWACAISNNPKLSGCMNVATVWLCWSFWDMNQPRVQGLEPRPYSNMCWIIFWTCVLVCQMNDPCYAWFLTSNLFWELWAKPLHGHEPCKRHPPWPSMATGLHTIDFGGADATRRVGMEAVDRKATISRGWVDHGLVNIWSTADNGGWMANDVW